MVENLHPTSIRLTDAELAELEAVQGTMEHWWPKTSPNRAAVIKMALSRGLEALRREMLVEADHLIAWYRKSLELGMPLPSLAGQEGLQALAGVVAGGQPVPRFWRGLRRGPCRSNRVASEAFREAIPRLGTSDLLLDIPLFCWPSYPLRFAPQDSRAVRPTVEEIILRSETWHTKGWAHVRFFKAGEWVVGLLSFVDLNAYPGIGVVNGIEALVGFLSACLGLDWERVMWVDHRPMSVFGDYLREQEFNLVLLQGEAADGGITPLFDPEWVRLPSLPMEELLRVNE